MEIIKDLKTSYHICYNANADECIRYASSELQKYLYASTLTLIPMFSDKCMKRSKEIHLGLIVRSNDYSKYVEGLSDEGFKILNIDDNLVMVSKSSRGVMYAVYYFLNKYINFNCLDSETICYDKVNEINFNEDISFDFPFEYRECYFRDAFTGEFASKNMLNSNLANLSSMLGGKVKWFNCHHSFGDLLSTDEYFNSHPEYFSLIDGKRRKEHTELCLSNPEVFEICLKRVKEWIKNNPNCKIFSVAQDEWMGHFVKMACECEHCKEIDDKYGAQSASIITFVNKIAEALEDEYPDILIHTFAYQYSRKPPLGLKVHKNVIVRLCNIECSWAESIEEGAKNNPESENAKFLKDLEGWSKLTNRLYIWDYAVNFRNYLLPFPNLRTMAKNIKLYKRLNVKGLLMQGNFSYGGMGYLDELKSFVAAKLMQDDYDLDELINYFCTHYYGKASPFIIKYINLFEDNIKGKSLWLYDDADSPLFTDEIVSIGRELIDKATKEVKDEDYNIRKHVKKLELSQKYLELVRMPQSTLKNDLIDKFNLEIREMGITELFERTNLDYSIEVMKKSRYAKERNDWYSLYYIMK